MMELTIAPLALLFRRVEIFLLITSHQFFNIGVFYMMSFVLIEHLKMTSIPAFQVLRLV